MRFLGRAAGRAAGFALAIGLLAVDSARGDVIRVPVDIPDLRLAFNSVAAGDTIRIAGNGGSTYYVNRGVGVDLKVRDDLTVQGGWRIDFAVRDPRVYVTVIRDDTITFDRPLIRIDGSHKVVVDGIQFHGGRHAILAQDAADLTVRTCLMSDHLSLSEGTGGGAIRMLGGRLHAEDTRIQRVVSRSSGAGIYLNGLDAATILNVTLSEALSQQPIVRTPGAGIYAADVDTLRLEGTTLSTGTTFDLGGLLHALRTSVVVTGGEFSAGSATFGGGAVSLVDCPSASFDDCTFEFCRANEGGAIHSTRTTALSIENSRFASNRTLGEGGAIWLESTSFSIVDCEFDHNHSETPPFRADRGGAVRSLMSNGTVRGTTFRNERAMRAGGAWAQVGGDVSMRACDFRGNDAELYGGALQIELGGKITVRDCLFEGNSAKFGGCLAGSFTGEFEVEGTTMTGNAGRSAGAALFVDTGARVHVLDSILCCATRGDLVFCSSAVAEFSHCDIWNDDAVNVRGEFGGGCIYPIGTDSNFSENPLFCDPAGSDDYRIFESSPCHGAASDGGDIGWAGVGCAAPAPLHFETSSWGSLKARYRDGRP
jgi:hypothetical protein